ncbi:replication protein [Bacillus sp. FJAT-45350]|uniref:replication protein n=1 Tax=Bacillus sp. FJAT-45350 TaxID=2011014 RepID=UPI001C545897|nr:replication protein [Bacillus sp. FJAT-45350]
MANVQLENGFTKLANEILEELAKIKLSPTQYRLLFVIWRYTYGFNRKEHNMTLDFLSGATGCDARQIQRELKRLEGRKVIFQKIKSGSTRKISFNKDHDNWIGKTAIGESANNSFGGIDNQEINKEKFKEKKDSTPYLEYKKHFGTLPPKLAERFGYWIEKSQFKEPEAIICEAIRKAKIKNPQNPAPYVEAILKKLHANRLFTLKAVREYNTTFQNKKHSNDNDFLPLSKMFEKKKREEIQLTEEEIEQMKRLENKLPF